ncbi:hypothetical protein MTO98_07200 [Mucilaginibacter sp. SMC90]|uniref:hypothetical protein n=1 Tax=Mucilaginibacter sp. SMC90 TaxID=2929803 RepID=UPI001FB1A3E2|nr:hypothetical protein [Mucilaginibacter sp. SMC90]UOE50862.1 hypothetical protein MTO98_07200 [Mucilaginibacter sp. SMC90]
MNKNLNNPLQDLSKLTEAEKLDLFQVEELESRLEMTVVSMATAPSGNQGCEPSGGGGGGSTPPPADSSCSWTD